MMMYLMFLMFISIVLLGYSIYSLTSQIEHLSALLLCTTYIVKRHEGILNKDDDPFKEEE